MVHHFEPLASRRVIRSTNIHHLLVLSVGVISQEVDDRNNTGGRNVEGELVLVDRGLLYESGESGHEESTEFL